MSSLFHRVAIESTGISDVVFEHISFDDCERHFRSAGSYCYSEFNPKAWRSARNHVASRVNEARIVAEKDHSTLRVLLLDDNFYFKSMRKRYRPHATIYLDVPIDVCLIQNRQRDFPVPNSVIEHMVSVLEVPKDRVNHPVLSLGHVPSQSSSSVIDDAFLNVNFWERSFALIRTESPKISIGLTTRDTAFNLLETKLRKCVSAVASRNRFDPSILKEVSKLKRKMMEVFKHWYDQKPPPNAWVDMIDSLSILFTGELEDRKNS